MTQEQLARSGADRARKKQLKEKFWPFLEVSCKTLTEAVDLLDVMKMGIEGAWNRKKGKSTLKSLDIKDGLNKEAPDYSKVKWLIDELQYETVIDSLNILTSLKNLINDYGAKEISKQPLTALKPQFDEEFKDI